MRHDPLPMADLFDPPSLPEPFVGWFTARGWAPREHQLELWGHAQAGRSALLIAPTGGGKTLAGFMPSLMELVAEQKTQTKPGDVRRGPHTLYISPLKALAVDVARNVETPIKEMDLPIRVETRTGDTPQSKRSRQKHNAPDILMTTPEQISLLLAYADAEHFFAGVRFVIFDELHALSPLQARCVAVLMPWRALCGMRQTLFASDCPPRWPSRTACGLGLCRRTARMDLTFLG